MAKEKPAERAICVNRKARHDYIINETRGAMARSIRLLVATFAFAVVLAASQVGFAEDGFSGFVAYPIGTDTADWSVDRMAPAWFGNVETFQGRDNVILLGIAPPASDNSRLNWQGYQQNMTVPAGNSFLRGDMWIADGWRTGTENDFVNTGMWGSAMSENLVAQGNYVDAAAVFPIVHFINQGGAGRLRVWDTTASGWVNLPETADLISYGGWNTIDLRLLPDEQKIEYLLNGEVFYTWDIPAPHDPDHGLPEQFFRMYLQARNNGVTSFDTYWSRLMSGLLIRSGEDIGSTPSDVAVVPGEGASRNVVVGDGAMIGGSVAADGGALGVEIEFDGSADIVGNVIGSSTAFQFGTEPGKSVGIGGDIELVNSSSTTGGSAANPVQVAGNVAVDKTSAFGGNWNIGGNLVVLGTLGPGNSIGTVTVAGNHTFGADSVYMVEIDGEGNADLLSVREIARLDGTVQVSPNDGVDDFPLGHAYTIVEAGGGFDGTRFDGASWTFDSAFLGPQLSYDSTNVFLTIDRNGTSFASAALTPNQVAAATVLDSLTLGNSVYNAVALTSAAGAAQALRLLSGEIYASTRNGLLEESRQVRSIIADRLQQVKFGQGGHADDKAQDSGIWIQGFGSFGETDSTANTGKVDRDVRGFIIGADGMLFDDWGMGLAGGYTHSKFDLDSRLSSASSDNFHVAAYGGTTFGAAGLRFGAAQSWHSIDIDRSVTFTRFSESLTSDNDARTTQVFGEIGYAMPIGAIDTEPFARLAYVHHHTDDFVERGGDAALHGRSSDDDLGFSTLGLRADKSLPISGGTLLTLEAMAGWEHALGDVSPTMSLAFDSGSPFTVEGAPIERNSAVLAFGFDLMSDDENISLSAAYGGKFSGDATSHDFGVTVSIWF